MSKNDLHLDPALLETGDTRNVVDHYRNWKVDAIRNDLDESRSELEIAIENVSRDFNMGTIVRTANAFNVAKIHIIGSRQWNKRGAMKTDAYMNIEYHKDVADFLESISHKELIAVDIITGAQPLHKVTLPRNAVLLFGSESDGISEQLLKASSQIVMIEQFGSTRSINVGVAAGIMMYAWVQKHRLTH